MFVISISFESIKEEHVWNHRVTEKITFREEKKSTMLRYKSPLVKTLYSLFYAPFLVPGLWEEAQTLSTKVISDFEVVPDSPLEAIRVTLESYDLDIYEASLIVQAKLKGYRYFMYHYPIASFLVGVPLLFPVIILILSAKVYCVSYSKQKKLLSSGGSFSEEKDLDFAKSESICLFQWDESIYFCM
ncbi:Seipin [Armadillidium vulgare]|nr:Seipin [Armadillidium vulgare]